METRLTSAQRRPYLVQQRNAISQRDTTVGRRFLTEQAAMTFAKNPANWEYNNTRVRVARDTRDGAPVVELLDLSWT